MVEVKTPVRAADPRVKRTRKLIQDAFNGLVLEKGFEALTVQDVAERATVNRSTFYAHFEDKYALLDASIGTTFTSWIDRRAGSPAPLSAEIVRNLLLTVYEFHHGLSNNCARANQELESTLGSRVRRDLQRFVADCLELTPAAVLPESKAAAVAVISTAIYGIGRGLSSDLENDDPYHFIEVTIPLVLSVVGIIDP